jgi:hypothetical protein
MDNIDKVEISLPARKFRADQSDLPGASNGRVRK